MRSDFLRFDVCTYNKNKPLDLLHSSLFAVVCKYIHACVTTLSRVTLCATMENRE